MTLIDRVTLDAAAHLGELREHLLQRLQVLRIDRDPAQCGELGDRAVHRLDGVRRIVPSSREQPQPECPRLLGDVTHALTVGSSARWYGGGHILRVASTSSVE